MTKKELIEMIRNVPMDARVILVDCTDDKCVEYDIDSISCLPTEALPDDKKEINLNFNEGIFTS